MTIAENPRPEVPTEFSREFILAEDPNQRVMIDRKVIIGLMGSRIHHGGVCVLLTADIGIPVLSQAKLEKFGWKPKKPQTSGRISTMMIKLGQQYPFVWIGEIEGDCLAIEYKGKRNRISVFNVSSKNPITLERIDNDGDFNTLLQSVQS